MKNLIKIGVAVLAMVPVHQANSASGNIPFNGSVADTCVVTVGAPGTLGANTSFTTLGSQEAGGAAGTATLLTTGSGFSLSADAPTAFDSAPTDGGTGVTFSANYSATGSNTISETNGATPTGLTRGNTNVTINMAADRASGVFPSGTYAATVVLRCE